MEPSNSYPESEKLPAPFQAKVFTIIVVEDDHDDTEFICDALKQIVPEAMIRCFANAAQALLFLKELADNELPTLFVLDYNLPITTGLELLTTLHADPKFQPIPKVMYTHSDRAKDKEQCMKAGATAYLKKSNSFDKIRNDALQIISLYNRNN